MLANWVKQAVTAGGTGNLTLGSADTGFIDLNTAIGQGPRFPYVIEDGSNRESGVGYLSASTTLVRSLVRETLVSGVYDNTSPTPITVTTAAKVMISLGAIDTAQAAVRICGTSAGMRRQISAREFSAGGFSTLTLTANQLYVSPFYWSGGYPIGNIYAGVSTAAAGKYCRLGLWDASDWTNAVLLADSGNISVASAVLVSNAIGPLNLSPGWYLCGIVSDGTPVIRAQGLYGENTFGWDSSAAHYKISYRYAAHTFGALPTNVDISAYSVQTTGAANIQPSIWLGE